MDMLKRTAVTPGGGMDFVISDGTLDRHGTRINPAGWDLANFRKNPIALFGHDSRFPLGTWSNIRNEGDRLVATLKLAAKGTSARIDEIIGLIEQGILRATSVGFNPTKFGMAGKDAFDFVEQELIEASVVSIGSNTNALAKARSLNVSPETLSLVFGESANERRGTVSHPGVSAAKPPMTTRSTTMTTPSQRIIDAQAVLVANRDKLATLRAADTLDLDAVEKTLDAIEIDERNLSLLEREEKITSKTLQAPATARQPLGFRQKDVGGFDLLVRKAVVSSVAMYSDKPVSRVLDERYPGHEATAGLFRDTAAAAATTGGSHYVDDLQQISYQGFVDALDGMSVLPALRARGLALNLDSTGTAYVPGVTAGGANGSFFAEGSPIRVGQIATTNAQMTSRKVGVIMAFSREAAKRSTPDLEALFRRRILADTAAAVDAVLLDATAQDSVRPGGLLYDQVASAAISAVATGYGGGDHIAVMADFKALLAPFIAANAATGITVIMNPAQGLSLDFMTGPDGALGDWFSRARARFNFAESTHATAGRLIAVRTEDFASAIGGVEFEPSSQATVHMEQTQANVEQIATSGTVAGTSPVISWYQSDIRGVRMIWDLNWRMIRPGMVQWIDGTSY